MSALVVKNDVQVWCVSAYHKMETVGKNGDMTLNCPSAKLIQIQTVDFNMFQ